MHWIWKWLLTKIVELWVSCSWQTSDDRRNFNMQSIGTISLQVWGSFTVNISMWNCEFNKQVNHIFTHTFIHKVKTYFSQFFVSVPILSFLVKTRVLHDPGGILAQNILKAEEVYFGDNFTQQTFSLQWVHLLPVLTDLIVKFIRIRLISQIRSKLSHRYSIWKVHHFLWWWSRFLAANLRRNN